MKRFITNLKSTYVGLLTALFMLLLCSQFTAAQIAWSDVGAFNGDINASTVDGSGNVYVGGAFTVAGGVTAGHVAMWDGSKWNVLGSGVNGTVNAIAVSGSNVYVGGSFTTAGGSSANYVAKWNGSAWSALGSGTGAAVNALAVDGSGNIYVGGTFTTAGGSGANYIAMWNPTGSSWSALSTGMNGAVQAIAISGSNVYAGGSFTLAGGSSANRIAKWNGSAWSQLDANGTNGTVYALAFRNTDLYIGGSFGYAGGSAANNIVRWTGSAWSYLINGSYNGVDGTVYSLAVDASNYVYLGGTFTAGYNNYWGTQIVKYNQTNNSFTDLSGPVGTVKAIAVSGTNVYPGGSFTQIYFTPIKYFAKYNGSAWSAVGSGIGGTVNVVYVNGTDVYFGGSFTTAGGIAANNIAKWNGSQWSALGSGVTGGVVNAIAVKGSYVYAGGTFTTAGGTAANAIAKWDGSTWATVGTNTFVGTIYAMAVSGNYVYVGGNITSNYGTSANNVLGLNTTDGILYRLPHNFDNNGTNGPVYALTGDGVGGVYVGGNFTAIGSLFPAHYSIAKWSGSAWSKLSGGTNATVRAIALIGTDVYAGGDFTTADYNDGSNVGANYVAKYSGGTWSALGAGTDGAVYSLVSSGSSLYAGGNFNTAGGTSVNYCAKYASSTWTSLGGTVFGTVTTMGYTGGSMYVAGTFASYHQNIAKFTDGVNPLPVELNSFTGSSANNIVTLNWKTATETNNYGFEIERTTTIGHPEQANAPIYDPVGRDDNWTKIGFVEGNGTTNAPKSYSFVDKSASGKTSYRLKQIDRDGKFEYSQTVEVTAISTPKEFALAQNYPNPFNPTTAISYQLSANGFTTLKIYDAIGREVATLVNEVKEAGSYSAQFDGAKLSSGIYFAKLTSDKKTQMKKLLLLK